MVAMVLALLVILVTVLTFAFPQPWDAATESPAQELKDERTLDMKVYFHIAKLISN